MGPSPILHGFHHQGRNSLTSLGIRLGFPALGTILGFLASSDCSECGPTDALAGAHGGLLLGMAVASFIDIAFLSYEERPSASRAAYSWTPRLGVSGSGFTAGVGGWF